MFLTIVVKNTVDNIPPGVSPTPDHLPFFQDFLACLPVASRLHHLRIVATSMKERDERRKELAAGGNGGGAIGADGGPARQEVEVRLMEAGWRMADAEAEQNYAVCTRLQREIKNLEVRCCCCCW